MRKRNQPRMKKCMHIECGGKLQPHSFDSAAQKGDRRTTGMDCDGPCSQRRVANWKHKNTTKQSPRTHVCCRKPHLPFGYDTEDEWIDCEAHGNEAPCPCGCGATQCNHITEDAQRADMCHWKQ